MERHKITLKPIHSNSSIHRPKRLQDVFSLVPDSLWLAGSIVVASGLNYVVQAVPAWFLPEALFAQYSIVLTLLLLGASTLGTGVSYEVAVATARGEPSADASKAIFVAVIPLSIVVTVLLNSSYDFGFLLAALAGAALIFQVALMLIKGVFLGQERIKLYSGFHLLEPAMKALFTLTAVLILPTATSAIAGYLLAVLLLLTIIGSRIHIWNKFRSAFQMHGLFNAFGSVAASLSMILTFLFVMSYGTLYLGRVDEVSTAYLAALLLIVRTPWYVLGSISITNLPKIAKTELRAERSKLYYVGLLNALKYSFGLYLVTAVVGKPLVDFLFPTSYGQFLSWPLFFVAALAHALLVVSFYKSMMLLAVRNSRHLWLVTVTGLASMALATWVLGSYGIWGVVLSMLAASLAMMVVARVDQSC